MQNDVDGDRDRSVELKALSQHKSSEQVCEMRGFHHIGCGWREREDGDEAYRFSKCCDVLALDSSKIGTM